MKEDGVKMNENWKNRITLFLFGQAISLLGSSIVTYAITFFIILNSESGIMLTMVVICAFLPTLLLSPFGGVWADRFDRKKLIIGADAFIALVTVYMFVMFYTGTESLFLLCVLITCRAFGAGIHTPCVNAVIPQIVPKDKLEKVNGIISIIQTAILLLGPILGGLVLSISSITYIFLIDIITAAIAILILILFIRIPVHEKARIKQENAYIRDMKEGFAYIKSKKYLGKFFVFYAVAYFLCPPVVFLAPLQVTRSFGSVVWHLTLTQVALAFGMVIGGVWIATVGGFKNRIHTVVFSSCVIGVCTIILGGIPMIFPIFWIYLVFLSMVGAGMSLYSAPVTIMLQEKVDSDFQGRVFGVLGMISSSMMPLGIIILGPIADRVAIEWLLIVTGTLAVIQSIILFSNKDVVNAGKPKENAK